MFTSSRLPQYLSSGLMLFRAPQGPLRKNTIRIGYVKFIPAITWRCSIRLRSTDHQQEDNKVVEKKQCPRMPKDSPQSRILTVPNILTLTRILLTPAIGYSIWHEMHFCALSYFTLAALTDLLDGLIARRFNQCSKFGAILDPVADKLLLTTCFLSLYHVSLLPVWLVGSFILRDIALLAGGACLRYRSLRRERIDLKKFLDFNNFPATEFAPTFVSKCNTALQCGLIVAHLGTHHLSGAPLYDMTIAGLHALTATTTTVSFIQYATRAIRQTRTSIKSTTM